MSARKLTDKLPFLMGKLFTNQKPYSPKYRTMGNTYLCIVPIRVNEGNSSIKVNGGVHFMKIGEPIYITPTDIYEFCGPSTVTMTFTSPTSSIGEEEIV